MKVLHVYKTFMPETFGGVEVLIDLLACHLPKYGIESTVLTVSPTLSESTIFNNFNVIRKKASFTIASCPFSLSLLFSYSEIVKDFDIIHVHFPWPFADLLTAICMRSRKQKILVTYHSDIVKQKYLQILYAPLMNIFFKRVDKLVVTSNSLLNSSVDLEIFKDKCTVIPLGVEVPNSAILDKERLKFWKDKVGDNFLLFIGQFRYYKGVHVLLEALKDTSILTVLIGGGGLEKDLHKQAQQLSLNNVKFVGGVSNEDKAILLKLCRVVVLPSIFRSEAFGIALLEGASYGKPLISTELGTGTSYVNVDSETGFVVPPNNPEKLREAIQRIFSDDELTKKMGQAAYQRFINNFTIDRVVQQYAECYHELLEHK